MPNILLRDIDDELDKALRIRAAEHGHTRELEIKTILQAAVKQRPQKMCLAEVLTQIPKVEEDFDSLIARSSEGSRSDHLGT